MRALGRARRTEIEAQVVVDGTGILDEPEVLRRLRPLDVLAARDDTHDVGLTGGELGQRRIEVGRDPPDEARYPRDAEKERRVRPQLDHLASPPGVESIRTAAHGILTEGMRRETPPRHRVEQMSRDDPHVMGRVVELLGVLTVELERDRPLVASYHRGDRP